MREIVAVLDIGKTNIKLCALDVRTGDTLRIEKSNNTVLNAEPYPHADIEGIWSWYCTQLRAFSEKYTVRYLCCTTHGATVVCLTGGRLAFPVYDYESERCEESDDDYENVRPLYKESLSPALKLGLNAGRQLYWLSKTEPEKFKQVDAILMYPQYWAWRLCEVAASEVTSLGCHTDLWQPAGNCYSSLVERMGWQAMFPPMRASGESLGVVSADLIEKLGLPKGCEVINGIHDSNASLVPYLLYETEPFTVISTGTWVVIANVGSSADCLAEHDDMLCNVSAFGDPVPSIRFMGGREWELLRGDEEGSCQELSEVFRSDVFLLPSFTNQGGPFSHTAGAINGPVGSVSESCRTTLASLYCALITDYCLSRIGSTGKIIVEGSFAGNTVYLAVLCSLRPEQEVLISNDTTGTTLGAAQLIERCNWPKKELVAVKAGDVIDGAELLAYKEHWNTLLPRRNSEVDYPE